MTPSSVKAITILFLGCLSKTYGVCSHSIKYAGFTLGYSCMTVMNLEEIWSTLPKTRVRKVADDISSGRIMKQKRARRSYQWNTSRLYSEVKEHEEAPLIVNSSSSHNQIVLQTRNKASPTGTMMRTTIRRLGTRPPKGTEKQTITQTITLRRQKNYHQMNQCLSNDSRRQKENTDHQNAQPS